MLETAGYFLKMVVVVVYSIIVFLQVDSFKTAGAILSLILLLLTFMLSTTLFTYIFAFVFSNYETCQSAMTTMYFLVSYKLYSYIIVDDALCGLGMVVWGGGGGCVIVFNAHHFHQYFIYREVPLFSLMQLLYNTCFHWLMFCVKSTIDTF